MEIIINSIDVSGCKHYKSRTCIADYCLTDMPFGEAKCELNPNCHYKQLKRKEQECEELKKKCNIYTCGICGNKEYCNKLYKTLTEIKEILLFNKKELEECLHNDIDGQILQKISEVLE